MGNVLREKYVRLCVNIVSAYQDYVIDSKTTITTIKRIIKSGKEIRVNANIYNKVLMLSIHTRMIFRYAKSLDSIDIYNDDVKEAYKCIKELYEEIKAFDEDPNKISPYVRCSKDKIRKVLKEVEHTIHDMDVIIHDLDQDIEMTPENYKIMNKLVKIYSLQANAVSAIVYSISILLKYRE